MFSGVTHDTKATELIIFSCSTVGDFNFWLSLTPSLSLSGSSV